MDNSTDNATPMKAKNYDQEIEKTIPFYSEFYRQTLDLVKSLPVKKEAWLDTGCGTGEFVSLALEEFGECRFLLCDPSEAMAKEAGKKLQGNPRIMDIRLCSSQQLDYDNAFDIITAIQSHHYMAYDDRALAIQNCYRALKMDGAFIFYENFAPNSAYTKDAALDRWGRYQQDHGKTGAEAAEHLERYGKNYFPITIAEHFKILSDYGFRFYEIFWLSYMQAGIYAVK